VLGAGLVGFALAWGLTILRLKAPPEALMRTNVSGLRVPAVLGIPVTLGALGALIAVAGVAALGWDPSGSTEVAAASAVVVAVMGIAGAVDDRRGEEVDRGFRGHLGALRRGRITGGMWKIGAGAAAGALAGILLFPGRPADAVATLLLVALSANAINLFDRAPGRAGKVVLVVTTPLMALGDPGWAAAAAGAVGALVAALPFDLGERAMLGDAGANPLGGVIGVGLAASLGPHGRWVAVVFLVVLNLASERWSFSATIASNRWLAKIDRMGRK
jgi:UDP-GlcNAc:undecaprenyl-phosphate/decaprenyl-phosphate GlcNAc-1-phosphate transferase